MHGHDLEKPHDANKTWGRMRVYLEQIRANQWHRLLLDDLVKKYGVGKLNIVAGFSLSGGKKIQFPMTDAKAERWERVREGGDPRKGLICSREKNPVSDSEGHRGGGAGRPSESLRRSYSLDQTL